jgi:epoxyqueuosine reductase
MKERIRQLALELGFDACRFTTASPPSSASAFQEWLDAGYHGAMEYLARNAPKRKNPALVLPEARTVIVLAASYYSDARPGTDSNNDAKPSADKGVIARYAHFNDYHEVLGAKLKSLCDWIDGQHSTEGRSLWYVDTGPVLERDLAQRAGLGFIGKHANLISREWGNWIFLGEILTPVELEPDAPETNRCGRCARCMAACPTQAIRAPFTLDARRCLAYLTIEHKGSIPLEWRTAMGRRVFGCDDCLAACPWNRFAHAGRAMRGRERGDLATPDLLELLELDEAGFRERFKGTPVLRLKRARLRRNVCVALGNTAGAEALPVLERAAGEPDVLVAEHAVWALERIKKR